MDALRSQRLISGNGTSESLWRISPQLEKTPCHPLNWWIPLGARLVVLAPHPDDEILACGALLQQHAQRGGDFLLIAATDGEASHKPTKRRTAAQLATTRQTETIRGLRRLGVSTENVVRLGLADGRLKQNFENLWQALEPLLSPNDVLVTTYMLDGHPDHEACGNAAVHASIKIGCRLVQAPVWLWHWAKPDERSIPWDRLHGFRIPSDSLALKLLALSEHVSQLTSADGTPILPETILQRSEREIEYFFL